MIWLFVHHYNTLIQSKILIIPSWSLPLDPNGNGCG
jgi:hypothetical protein